VPPYPPLRLPYDTVACHLVVTLYCLPVRRGLYLLAFCRATPLIDGLHYRATPTAVNAGCLTAFLPGSAFIDAHG